MGRKLDGRTSKLQDAEPQRLLECTVLIPIVRDSDRRSHTPLAWRDLQDDFRTFSKGFSGPEGCSFIRKIELVPGEDWQEVSDESRKYVVDVQESRVDQFRELIRGQCVRFDQRAIRITVGGVVEYVARVTEPDEGDNG